jgi:hypothetical protein
MHTKTTFLCSFIIKIVKIITPTRVSIPGSSSGGIFVERYSHFIYILLYYLTKSFISHAFNTTIPHASTSAIYYLQYFYNLTTFNESFYKILTYNI